MTVVSGEPRGSREDRQPATRLEPRRWRKPRPRSGQLNYIIDILDQKTRWKYRLTTVHESWMMKAYRPEESS